MGVEISFSGMGKLGLQRRFCAYSFVRFGSCAVSLFLLSYLDGTIRVLFIDPMLLLTVLLSHLFRLG
jgi:hypothetical protein